jgi:hypothetical protein
MKVSGEYSHLNGKEYLLVHHKSTLQEIYDVIAKVDASKHLTKESQEKTKKGKFVYSPGSLNEEYKVEFYKLGWEERRRNFFVSTDPNVVKQLEPLGYQEQKELLEQQGLPLYPSFNQTDFVKNKIAVEVQLGKYFAVTYDLFVKHLSFYTGEIIDVGIEIVPMKSMQREMSSGPPWFEKEVHNVLRHGRTNPPVPLLIIGIEP